MTEQEKIRGGLARIVTYDCEGCTQTITPPCTHPCAEELFEADKILNYLKSRGMVLKVEGELPSIFGNNETLLNALEYEKELDGYYKVEPLV